METSESNCRCEKTSCGCAGIAVERLRTAGAKADPEALAGMIHDVWRQLEAEATA